MIVQLFADPPAGDAVNDKLQAIPGVVVTYIRNPQHKQILIHKGVAFIIAMNTHGHGKVLRAEAKRLNLRFITIPPNWSGAEQTLRSAGFFNMLEKEQAEKPVEPKSVFNAPRLAPASVLRGGGVTPVKPPTEDRSQAFDPAAIASPTPAQAPAPVAPTEPVEAPPAEPAPAAERVPQRPYTPNAERLASHNARYDWLVAYFRHNPGVTQERAISALRKRYGLAVSHMSIVTAAREAKELGALPPTPDYPISLRRIQPADGVVLPAKPATAEDDVNELPPDVEAAAVLLHEALLRESGLVVFSLTLSEGKVSTNWERRVLTTQRGSRTF
jgi:hypothetical protein